MKSFCCGYDGLELALTLIKGETSGPYANLGEQERGTLTIDHQPYVSLLSLPVKFAVVINAYAVE